MTSLARRSVSMQPKDFNDFYEMIDSFFNDDFTPQRAMNTASFKVDIIEGEKDYMVEAELPGFEKEDIKIEVDEGKLTLTAEHIEEKEDSEEKNYVHRERKTSRVSRNMYFKDIDEENIVASLDKGILSIQIPKKEAVQTIKNIQIN